MRRSVRFGLGKPDGIRSSSWKVWAGADSTVYIATRDIGTSVKVSLHPPDPARPGGEWRVALTSERARLGRFRPGDPWFDALAGSRVMERWDSEECRLGSDVPLKQGFAVTLGRFSMGLHPPNMPEQQKRPQDVTWIEELPSIDQAWQFTILVSDPGVITTPPGQRSMRAIAVGNLVLPNRSVVWVMRHLIPVSSVMMERIHQFGVAMVSKMVETHGRPTRHGVYRGHILGWEEQGGLRYFLEVAATHCEPAGALDRY